MNIEQVLETIPLGEEIISITEPDRDTQTKALLPTLTGIARDGFGTEMTDNDVAQHVLEVDRLCIIRQNSETVGFASYTQHEHKGMRILYVNGFVVRQEAQQHGLYGRVNRLVLGDMRPDYLVGRTQNPVVYAARRKLVSTIYPNEQLHAPPLVREIARLYGGERMEPDRFVVRGCYGRSLYDRIPEHRSVSAFFNTILRLDYARGDAVIMVGVL